MCSFKITHPWSSFSFLFIYLHLSNLPASANSKLPCYPAVFSFGDSLYDTGNARSSGNILAFFANANVKPYGETYFGHPANRYSDGRLIIDFIVQSLGLPFLQPYLNITSPAGPQFTQGVNYAVAGSYANTFAYFLSKGVFTVLSPLTLDVQLSWHQTVIRKVASENGIASNLPKQSDFSKALYILEFGGNDYGAFLISRRYTLAQIQSDVLPKVIQKITNAVEVLYQNEARNFLIQGVTPEGCTPLYLDLTNTSKLDSNGCRNDLNQLDIAHNTQLRAAIQSLREKYPDISISFADIFGAYINIIESPSSYGFTDTINACCGGGPGYRYNFSYRKLCGRRSYLCADPRTHVVWDGIHPTDAFSREIVNKFISGEFLDPPNALECASPILS